MNYKKTLFIIFFVTVIIFSIYWLVVMFLSIKDAIWGIGMFVLLLIIMIIPFYLVFSTFRKDYNPESLPELIIRIVKAIRDRKSRKLKRDNKS